MIVTTSYRPTLKQINFAHQVAQQFNFQFISRNKRTIEQLHQVYGPQMIVVDEQKIMFYHVGEPPIYFHPNSAMFRIKRLQQGQHDPLIEMCELQPTDHVLDGTFGLGSDSLVLASQLTSGHIIATELNPTLAMIMSTGMQYHPYTELQPYIDKITLLQQHHYDYLLACEDNSFDIVYFDPMFDKTITSSSGMQQAKHTVEHQTITQATIEQALRVTKRAVILRNHFKSKAFDFNNCYQCIRKNTKFHYWRMTKLN